MKISSASQGSAEWFTARAGHSTGSHCADIMAFLKGGKGETQKRADYRSKLVVEILTGAPVMDGYLSPEMIWGADQEKNARVAYEMKTGAETELVGFCLHDTIGRMGGSPDALIGEDGILEIKCPKSKTHIEWILAGAVPPEHEAQMSFYLAVTGREWADFASYDPRLPEPLRLFTKRLWRDPERIKAIEEAVQQFNFEVDSTIARLKEIAGNFELPQMAANSVTDPGDWAITDADIRAVDPQYQP